MDRSFEYRRAREVAETFGRHGVRYLFLGKAGAILLGFSDTTQDVDLFVEKGAENGRAAVAALVDLGFPMDEREKDEIVRGKDFVQLRDGPFDLDLVFAPDGIDSFQAADRRKVVVEGMPVCHPDDIIRSKEAANRVRDLESLPRLRAFRDWWAARK